MKILELLIITVLSSLPGIIRGQSVEYDLNHQFSVSQLQEDFDILRQCLQTVHPGLYTYRSETEINRLFDSLRVEIERPMTELEFYRHIGGYWPLSAMRIRISKLRRPATKPLTGSGNYFLFR